MASSSLQPTIASVMVCNAVRVWLASIILDELMDGPPLPTPERRFGLVIAQVLLCP